MGSREPATGYCIYTQGVMGGFFRLSHAENVAPSLAVDGRLLVSSKDEGFCRILIQSFFNWNR